jgi:hypothetical protein
VGRNPAHRLSNLSIVSSSSHRLYADGLNQCFLGVLKVVGANEAATVGVSPPVKDLPGHAIAIHRLNKDYDYHLFDPNFGVYAMELGDLYNALLFLFREAYPDTTGLDVRKGDFHAYEVDGRVSGDYVVFKKKAA